MIDFEPVQNYAINRLFQKPSGAHTMGWRFRKSFKILPGIRLNVGKKGPTSVSVGKGIFTTNINPKGVRQNIHVPGTGATYQTNRTPFAQTGVSPARATPWVAIGTVGGILVVLITVCSVCSNSGSPIANSSLPKPTPAAFFATPSPTAVPLKSSKPSRKSKARSNANAGISAPILGAPVTTYGGSTSSGPIISKESRYITGPRGGCYYINSHGNKTYVDHSYCN
jgi:hypothetical protein